MINQMSFIETVNPFIVEEQFNMVRDAYEVLELKWKMFRLGLSPEVENWQPAGPKQSSDVLFECSKFVL